MDAAADGNVVFIGTFLDAHPPIIYLALTAMATAPERQPSLPTCVRARPGRSSRHEGSRYWATGGRDAASCH
jgi:hypothetical protein